MINTLGLLEVDGMIATIDAADAILKTTNVRLLSHEMLNSGCLMLVVEGDLTACHAALNIDCATAICIGRIISHREIGQPDGDTQRLTVDFNRRPK